MVLRIWPRSVVKGSPQPRNKGKKGSFPDPFAEVPCGGRQVGVHHAAEEAFEVTACHPVVVLEVPDDGLDGRPSIHPLAMFLLLVGVAIALAFSIGLHDLG